MQRQAAGVLQQTCRAGPIEGDADDLQSLLRLLAHRVMMRGREW
jgi:hypothetical protein